MPARSCFAALVLVASALATHAADDPYGDPLPAGAKTRLGTIRYRIVSTYSPIVTPDGETIHAYDGSGLRCYDITGADLGPARAGPTSEPPTEFSADGTRAVIASQTTTVWNVASGKTLVTLKRAVHFFDRGLPLVSLSADGKVLACGAVKREAKDAVDVLVWDVDGNKEIARFTPPQDTQALVALAPDGKTVATWGKGTDPTGKGTPESDPSRYVNFWDATTGKPLAKVRAAGYSPTAVAFAPDGSVAAVAGGSTIELVDPKTGDSKQLFLGRSGIGQKLAFSPDGTTLFATSNAGLVQRWRIADGARLSTTEPPAPNLHYCSLRVTAADRAVAWATSSNVMAVWEVPSGKWLGPQDGHFGAVQRVTVTPDSKFVLTSSYDNKALKWELATGKLVGPVSGQPWRGGGGTGVADFSPNGAKALISDFGGYGVHDGTTGVQEFLIPADRPNFHRAAFTADGSKVITCLASYDGKTEPAEVGVWDVATAKRLFAVRLPGHTTITAALTPDGKHLITASRKPAEKGAGEFFVTAYSVPDGAKKGEHREESGYGNAFVATAGDNATAAVVTSKGKLLRFDLATGKAESPVTAIEHVSSALAFSADGKLLAAFGSSSFGRPAPIVVLDWETGKVKHTFSCPDKGPTCAAFSPDGKYLVTGTGQATALVWELTK